MEQAKPWYASKTVWGSLVAGAAIVAGFFGLTVGAEDQASIVDSAVQIVGAIGAALAIYGRITAKTVIG